MGIELGRISGPLLARDLVRKNSGLGEENLAFETDLLFLDVINGRVGINTDTPSSTRKLDVNGTIGTNNLLVPTQFETPNFVVSTNRIQNLVDKIYIQPDQATDPKIAMPKIGTANLRISDQLIENIISNSDINLSPNGDGITEVTSSELYVDGNIHSTGDITWDGDITFGSDDSDNVEFSADVNSHIIPNINKQYDLGTSAKRWDKIYTKNINTENVTLDTITVNNINLLLTQGNTYYVSINGNDTYVGDHLHNTFRTIKYALSQATAGDTVVIFPGTYEEIFPLTVPAGVAVNGAGIRAVTVKPTTGTNTNNAFLLNGESTVSHLTVKDFYQGNAFSFAPGFTVTSRSPYVQNITVITSGPNAGNGALVDGSLAISSSREASMLFHSVTFIVPGAYGVKATNGARVEWLDCFTYFAETGIYLTQGVTGRQVDSGTAPGTVTVGPAPTLYSYSSDSVALDKAFYSQSLVDSLVGQTAVIDRYPSQPLFYTVVSVETEPTNSNLWRMTFETTFDTTGQLKPISFYPDAETTLIIAPDIWATTGNSVGEKWVAFYKTALPPFFATTVGPDWTINLAGLIWIVDYVIEDPVNTNMWRIYVTTSLTAGVGIPIFSSPGVGTITKYGAEVRSIGSANVYGTYGSVADGADTLAYLISHNFAYIGTGTDTSNDPKLVIQANEVVETNDGRIYYESVDAKGDFRIGDIFYINQETGAVVFDAQAITFSPTGSISLEGPTSSAYIDYSVVQVGNIRIHDNNIDSLIGPVNFSANSGSTYLNTDVFVTGNTVVSADITLDGNLYLGNQSTDTITVFSNLTQDLLPDDVGPAYGYTLGAPGTIWDTLYSTGLIVDNVTQVTNNTISTLTTDTDLIIQANGTGKVIVTNTDVEIADNLTVNGTTLTVNGDTSFQEVSLTGNVLQTGNWNQTGNSYFTGDILTDNFGIMGSGSYITFPNFKIQNNEISVTATNQDLILQGNTTGAVVFDDIVKITGTKIEVLPGLSITETGGVLVTESGIPFAIEGDVNATQSLSFAPNGTGNTIIDTTNAIKIPVGNNGTRTLSAGEIRYNSITNLYEGGGATGGLISFNGLYDSDRNTYITTGPTDNVIYFGINNVVRATIDSTALNSSVFQVDNVRFTGNTISNTVSGNNLTFAPNGTGNTVLTDIGISQNNIVNLNNTPLILQSTGIGYVKFNGTNGLVVPVGDDSNRRSTPEIGELRYNTQAAGVLEVFNGTDWMLAVGNNATISEADVLDILDLWTLILG